MDLFGAFVFVQVFLLHQYRAVDSSELGTSPQFTAQPSDVTAVSDRSATINCRASGTPQPGIVWYKDDARVVLESRLTVNRTGALVISSVRAGDAGSYFCVANNTVGSVQSYSARLQIANVATVAISTRQQSIRQNSPHTLSCLLPTTSIPPATVSWQKPSGLITSSSSELEGGRIGLTLNGTLVFSYWTSGQDTGTYRCTVTNSLLGSRQQSSTYFLTLDRTPTMSFVPVQFVATSPTSRMAIAGQTVKLECFTTGSPWATTTWEKDGMQLVSSQHVSFTQASRVLTLQPVAGEDRGRYTCIANQTTSTGPRVIRRTTDLSVIVPPTITQSFSETTVNVTQSVQLTCRAQGSSPLTWTWFRNKVMLTSGRVGYNPNGLESTLTISRVEESDGGVYQCRVEQMAYRTVAAANELLVAQTVRPFFTHGARLRDMLVFTGSTVFFNCSAIGFPAPQFTWTKGSTRTIGPQQGRYHLSSSPGNCSLTIDSAEAGDTAVYQCNASSRVGHSLTNAVQLFVTAQPTILQSPMDRVLREGDTVLLPCRASLSTSSTTLVYFWFKNGARDDTLTTSPSSGDLTLTNFQSSQNGLYECYVSITATGVAADPLVFLVGRAVVTVGAPPSAPSPPQNLRFGTISSSSFLALWDIPSSNGNLPLQNYTIEIQRLGNPLCRPMPLEMEWRSAVLGQRHDTTSATVGSLLPYTQYRFRMIAFNSVLRSLPSPESDMVWTDQTAPLAPPTNLAATLHGTETLPTWNVTWNPPAPCTMLGGLLTDYTVRFRSGLDRLVGSNTPYLLLSSLLPSTTYHIMVAAHTSVGRGPFSSPINFTTPGLPLPGQPTNVQVHTLNSTAVQLTWQAPTTGGHVTQYWVTYGEVGDEMLGSLSVNATQLNAIVSNLQPGAEYLFSVSSLNAHGEGANATVIHRLPPPAAVSPFYEQVWFYVLCGVAGLLVVCVTVLVCVCLCCKMCCKIGSENGKIYITSRRSGSSMSAASSGFSEYQHKHKIMSRILKVHDSPTPSRRSTDYADLQSLRQSSFGDSIVSSAVMNGDPRHHPKPHRQTPHNPDLHSHHMDPHTQMPYNIDDQYIPDGSPHCIDSPDGYDHMPQLTNFPNASSTPALHSGLPPPPPPPHYPHSQPEMAPKSLSQDSESAWNPTDSLNYRGHMTNHPISHSSSIHSSVSEYSTDASDPPPSQHPPHQRPHSTRQGSAGSAGRTQLPPLQEDQVMDNEVIYSVPAGRYMAAHKIAIRSRSMDHAHKWGRGNQHPSQLVHSQTRSSRTRTEHGQQPDPGHHPRGYKQMLPQQQSASQPAHLNHPSSHKSTTSPHNPEFHSDSRNVELSELHKRHQFQLSADHSASQPPTFSLPPPPLPPPTMQHSIEPVASRHHQAPDQDRHDRQRQDHRRRDHQTRHGSSPPERELERHQGSSVQPGHGPPHMPCAWGHSQSPERSISPKEGSLKPREAVQQWVMNQTMKSGQSDSKLTQGGHDPMRHNPRTTSQGALHHPSTGHPPPHSQLSSKWSIEEEIKRLEHSLQQTDEKGHPPKRVLNGMKRYPDVVQHSAGTTSPPSGTANLPLSSPERTLGSVDPHKPHLKRGKVPGAIWKPRPMNQRVESSSDSESESVNSGTEYDPRDNTSLKSAHV